MKTQYDAYYRSIPNLDRNEAASKQPDAPARRVRSAPNPVTRQPSVLEAIHPDIVQAVTLLWGHPEMNRYFEKLWLADGIQTPIAPEAMSELMLLAGVHRWLSPELPARNMASIYDASNAPVQRKDVWGDVPRRR
jgi:hypothetical protein